jgi:hypothetical protein
MERIITGLVAKVVVLGLLVGSLVQAAEPAVGAAKSITDVLRAVSAAGYESITEVSLDDGEWEVEVLKGGKPLGLRVDPLTAKVRFEYADEPHPALPASAKPLTAIVESLTAAGYSHIFKADFERGHWEIDAISAQGRRELSVDPSGKVLSDRVDD